MKKKNEVILGNLRSFKILSCSNFKKKLIFNTSLLNAKKINSKTQTFITKILKNIQFKNNFIVTNSLKESIYNLSRTKEYTIATLKSYILLQQYKVNFLFFKIGKSKQNFLNPFKLNIERKNYF